MSTATDVKEYRGGVCSTLNIEHLTIEPNSFPESWMEDGSKLPKDGYRTVSTPFRFTSKEQDRTGFYYFGARYPVRHSFSEGGYDPITAVWLSPDPALEKFLPTRGGSDEGLLGRGGVFNSRNLGLYTYTHQNPVALVDPDGRETQVIIIYNNIYGLNVGAHAAVRVDNSGNPIIYDPAGSFSPTDEYGGTIRGTGDILYGEAANLDNFIQYHQERGDNETKVYTFKTTPKEEAAIAKQAESAPCARGGQCASKVSKALKQADIFSKIKETFFPSNLDKQLDKIKSEEPKVYERSENTEKRGGVESVSYTHLTLPTKRIV